LVRILENRAYDAMEACQQREQHKAKRQRQGKPFKTWHSSYVTRVRPKRTPAHQLKSDFTALAQAFEIPLERVYEMLHMQGLSHRKARRWQEEAVLRQQLGSGFETLAVAVADIAERTVRASSVIENLNSRLRFYFFLRRHLGADYLELLRFFLNHRRFMRSDSPERVGKSPAELLTGSSHPHWLEMLGYTRFSRN
jgi:hypothetical protein